MLVLQMRRSPRSPWRARRRIVRALGTAGVVIGAVGMVSGALQLGTAGSAAAATVTVQRGQTLTQIAKQVHSTIAALVAANHLADPNRVYAGQVLTVPVAGGSPGVALASAQLPAGSAGTTFTVKVQRGQTLTQIAKQVHSTIAALVAANHLADPNRVYAGQVLTVPVPAGNTSTMALASYQVPATGSYPAGLLAHPSRLALQPSFVSAASTYGVPLSVLEAMCWWESGWQSTVVSSTGAIGVCQIEPQTATFINQNLVHTSLDPHVAGQNIALGAAYLASLLRATNGDVSKALAGYYQGLVSVTRHGMLPSTTIYVKGIEAYAAVFAA